MQCLLRGCFCDPFYNKHSVEIFFLTHIHNKYQYNMTNNSHVYSPNVHINTSLIFNVFFNSLFIYDMTNELYFNSNIKFVYINSQIQNNLANASDKKIAVLMENVI